MNRTKNMLLYIQTFLFAGEKPFQCNVCGRNFSQVSSGVRLPSSVFLFAAVILLHKNPFAISNIFLSRPGIYRHICGDIQERGRTSVSYVVKGEVHSLFSFSSHRSFDS